MFSWWIAWLIIAIVMLVIEIATTGLTTLWFAVGALVAMVLDLCHAPLVAQISVMAVISAVCFTISMIWIRPRLEELRKKNAQRTNADRVIGKEGVVIVPLNSVEGKGQVKVAGQVWSAKADIDLEEGSKITVKAIEGVKLVVERAN
ncbi:MAG: NfeD family protein [Saccharofermentans sp.]|nr:NfeD family protein [Saccharofermentans sp.]